MTAIADRARQLIALLVPDSGTGSPVGSIVPVTPGQQYLQTGNGHIWLATGMTNEDWIDLSAGGGGGGGGQTLAFVDISTNVQHVAAPNELTIVVAANDPQGSVVLPTGPPEGTRNTVVNATGISGSELASFEVAVPVDGIAIWGRTAEGVVNDAPNVPLVPGESLTLQYVADVFTWDVVTDSTPVQDTGLIMPLLVNTTSEEEYATLEVMPPWTSNQGQFFSQAPPDGQAWKPLQAVSAGDLIQVIIGQSLNPDLWDDIEVAVKLLVWDFNGANLIEVTANALVDSTYADGALTLTLSQLIGTDLSVTEDGLSITSAAGGVYNVKIDVNAGWN